MIRVGLRVMLRQSYAVGVMVMHAMPMIRVGLRFRDRIGFRLGIGRLRFCWWEGSGAELLQLALGTEGLLTAGLMSALGPPLGAGAGLELY